MAFRILTALQRRPVAALARRCPSRGLAAAREDLVLSSTDADGVTLITLNNPTKYNAWTQPMLEGLISKFAAAADDEACKGLVLTGAGPYYCAGVDLSATLKPMAPAKLREIIYTKNKAVFDTFLNFPKPICVAVNGPAIGASVTTATLADGVVASEAATFSTPFSRLGVPPEGCSSVHFETLMGAASAERMLGPEGWVPTGAEAAAAGLVDACVPAEALVDAAKEKVRAMAADPAYKKAHRGDSDTQKLLAVNDSESKALADAFLDYPFLKAQAAFLESKGKTQAALVFKTLVATRPLWALFL